MRKRHNEGLGAVEPACVHRGAGRGRISTLGGVLRPQVEALGDANSDEVLEEAKAKGMTDTQASCFADGWRRAQLGSDLDGATVSAEGGCEGDA